MAVAPKNRNSNMGCPGKWKHGYQNLQFAPPVVILTHTHMGVPLNQPVSEGPESCEAPNGKKPLAVCDR